MDNLPCPPQEWLEQQIAAWLEGMIAPRPPALDAAVRREARRLATHLRANWQARCRAERDLADLHRTRHVHDPDRRAEQAAAFLTCPESLLGPRAER